MEIMLNLNQPVVQSRLSTGEIFCRDGNMTLPAHITAREIWMELHGILKNTGTLIVESQGDVTMWSHAASTPHQLAEQDANPDAHYTSYGLVPSAFRLHALTVKADGKVYLCLLSLVVVDQRLIDS